MSGHILNHNGEDENTTTTSTTVSSDSNENDTSTTTIPTTTTTVVEVETDVTGFLPQFIKHPSVVHFPIAYSVAIPFVAIYKQNSYNPFSIIRTYLVLSLGNAFFILYIGYLGGKIVWG